MPKVKTEKRSRQFRFDPIGSGFVRSEFGETLNRKRTRYEMSPSPGNIRVQAKKFSDTRWGGGLDEMVQTRLLSTNPMGFGKSDMSRLFDERMPTTDLVWATKPGVDTPLAGHTPSLKTHEGRTTRGTLTAEHGTRDGLREQAILSEPSADTWGTKARLATIKYMMAPGEELLAQDKRLSSHDEPIFSAHTSIGDLRKPKELTKFARRQQAVREQLKWETARDLMGQGRHELVPKAYQTYLAKQPGSLNAMQAFESDLGKKKVKANTATTSQTDDLTGHSLSQMATSRMRALSPPRGRPSS